MCKVSVIVPVYNGERYLRACLESLEAQTLEGVEVVVVDDGSTDGSLAIAREFEERCASPRFRVFSIENHGVSYARNYGIQRSGGAYLTFADCDDTAEPDYCGAMYEKALRDGNDLVMCRRDRIMSAKGGGSFTDTSDLTYIEEDNFRMAEHPELFCRLNAGVWCKLFKREFFDQLRFPEGIRVNEDLLVGVEALCLAKKIGTVRRVLYHYYSIHQGVTSRFGEERLDWLPCMDRLLAFVRENGLTEALGQGIEALCVARTQEWYPRAVLRCAEPWQTRARYVREAQAYLRRHFPNWRENPYLAELKPQYLQSSFRRYYGERHLLALIHLSRVVPPRPCRFLVRAEGAVARRWLSLWERRANGSRPPRRERWSGIAP